MRIAKGETTSEALVRACLSRIAEREPEVGAWKFLDPDLALAQARACDDGPARGPLHGLPIGVKDLIDTVDMPSGYGSPIYQGHRPAWDAACVALVRAAGGVIMGKTVTSEFGAYHLGKTNNPHNPARSPGFSSMGSAAAIADFMIPLAFGTQTGGSIIRPASFCGAVGFKPSFGTFNRTGIKPLADSLDTLGCLARTVEDVALLGKVLSGRPGFGAGVIEDPPRIGFCRTHAWSKSDEAVQTALEDARSRLSTAGAPVTDVELPEAFAGLNQALRVILSFEAARGFAYEYQSRRHELSGDMCALIEQGLACPADRYDEARALAVSCRMQLADVFGGIEVLLTPSAECEPPLHKDAIGDSMFNRLWTLLHLPCLSLPTHRSSRGLPVGIQLVGPLDEDGRLIRIGRWIATKFA